MRMDVSMNKTKKGTQMTVLMTSVKVYLDGVQIGFGWMFETDYGMTAPELYKMNGDKLESGWYNLVYEEDRLAIMTETIQ